jgi:hypothetical protein
LSSVNLLGANQRRNFLALLPVIVILSMGTILGLVAPRTSAYGADHAGVAIPLYNYPDSTWTTIVNVHAEYPNVPIIAVVNPDNGPGSSEDPTFLAGIKQLQAGGVTVLGYVDLLTNCECSVNPLSAVENEVSEYWSWYHTNGIMFDDFNNGFTYSPSTYSSLSSYVKSLGMTYTMGNPGTSVSDSYIGTLSNLCIYESNGYPSLSSITYAGYPASDFTFVAYGVSFDASLVTSAAALVGYMYIDNQSGSNPYVTLSSLFTQTVSTLSAVDAPVKGTTSSTSSKSTTSTSTKSTTSSTTVTTSSTTTVTTGTDEISLSAVKDASGTVSSSPYQITIPGFAVGTRSDRLLLVGVSANNDNVASVTFGGVALKSEVSSFYNNDAEFWYLLNPSGKGNIVVTMAGPTSVTVGAYALAGVSQSNPLPTHVAKYNTGSSSPSIAITTKYDGSWVVSLASIWGGSTLGSPTCTSSWDVNIPDAITGAASTHLEDSPGQAICSWTASPSDQWDDVAVEVQAAPASTSTIKVESVDLAGTLFTGMWTTVQSADGTVLDNGYTTLVFQGKQGASYKICVANYGSSVFSRWANGDTSSCVTLTLTSNTVLKAYYST